MNPLPIRQFRRLCWFGSFLWAATIFYLSSRTGPQIEELNVFEIGDKIAHAAAFAAGAVPLLLALRLSVGWPLRKVVLMTVLILAIYGALDEIHQLSTPNRSGADPADWAADALGAALGTALTSFLYVRYWRTSLPAPARD